MKRIILCITALAALSFTSDRLSDNTSILIAPDSQLLIHGKTNVNQFKCAFNTNELNKPIPVYYKIQGDRMVFESAKLVLDTDCFDCGSRGINKDFRKLLKSEMYPHIEMHLKEIKRQEFNALTTDALIELHIAGVSKSYFLPLEIEAQNDIFVSGVLKLDITDFGMEAPKKALGLIVVSEDIEIKFRMNIKECND